MCEVTQPQLWEGQLLHSRQALGWEGQEVQSDGPLDLVQDDTANLRSLFPEDCVRELRPASSQKCPCDSQVFAMNSESGSCMTRSEAALEFVRLATALLPPHPPQLPGDQGGFLPLP